MIVIAAAASRSAALSIFRETYTSSRSRVDVPAESERSAVRKFCGANTNEYQDLAHTASRRCALVLLIRIAMSDIDPYSRDIYARLPPLGQLVDTTSGPRLLAAQAKRTWTAIRAGVSVRTANRIFKSTLSTYVSSV